MREEMNLYRTQTAAYGVCVKNKRKKKEGTTTIHTHTRTLAQCAARIASIHNMCLHIIFASVCAGIQ